MSRRSRKAFWRALQSDHRQKKAKKALEPQTFTYS